MIIVDARTYVLVRMCMEMSSVSQAGNHFSQLVAEDHYAASVKANTF